MFEEMKRYEEPQEGEALPLPRYRALMPLCYSDLVRDIGLPELEGRQWCAPGEITALYWPLRRYPERVELLINMGAIEVLPTIPKTKK